MKGCPMFAPGSGLKRLGALRLYPTIATSALFDSRWYRRKYLQGFASLVGPRIHYLLVGHHREFDPSPLFDTGHYLEANPDVKKSNLNALFHFHHYGEPERRSALRSTAQMWNFLFPDSRELPTFRTPRRGELRLTVVIDSCTLKRSDQSLEQILATAARLAREHSRSLRVISLLPNNDGLNAALSSISVSTQGIEFSLITSPPHRYTTSYDVYDDDIFLATSWTSSHALRFTAPREQLWVFAPETLQALLPDAKKIEGAVLEHSDNISRTWSLRADYGDHPVVARLAPRSEASGSTPCHLGIFVNPGDSVLLYAWTLRELDTLLHSNPSLAAGLSITIIGEGLRPIRLLESITPAMATRASKALVKSLDVCVHIAATPSGASSVGGGIPSVTVLPGDAFVPGVIADLLAGVMREKRAARV